VIGFIALLVILGLALFACGIVQEWRRLNVLRQELEEARDDPR
jgi:hypothetical protein